MRNKIIALAAGIMLLLPQVILADTAEDFNPGSPLITFELSLKGKLQEFLTPLFVQYYEAAAAQSPDQQQDAKTELLISKLTKGDRFFLSFMPPETLLITVPLEGDDWATFTAGNEKEAYNSIDVYKDIDSYFAKITAGGQEFGVFSTGNTTDTLYKLIDIVNGSSTDSLKNNAEYNKMTSSYISPRLASFTVDVKSLLALIQPMISGLPEPTFYPDSTDPQNVTADPAQMAIGMFDLFKYMGGSFADAETGYKFNIKVSGDEEKLKAEGLAFNSTGEFMPNLFGQFPNAKPIFYTESFNPAAEYEMGQKIIAKMQKDAGANASIDVFEELKKRTGFDMAKVYAVFTHEFAFGVQYDTKSPLPYITLMGRVGTTTDISGLTTGANTSAKIVTTSTKEEAKQLISDLTEFIQKSLKKSHAPKKAYKITEENGFTKISIDLKKLEKDYDGPPFPKLVFTFGVTDDDLFIISNYPDIDKAEKRMGFEFVELNGNLRFNSGVNYLNARNFWGFVDNLTAWAEKISDGNNAPPIDFYQGYYSILEKLYGWRDLLLVEKNTASDSEIFGTINIDNEKHKTYKEFLDELMSADKNENGIKDFDEKYLYGTSVEKSDSDGDGVSDIEALEKGLNPKGGGALFNDVGEDAYYTDETAFLYQQGAISGYSDGSFRPGNLVNRAEFTAMVIKAFEQDTSSYLGVNVELGAKKSPFADVPPDEWFYAPVAKAYGARFISGNMDSEGNLIFRPGDNITRAEALAILNKASKALNKSRPKAKCSKSPFTDVSEDDWFCDAVANGYKNGITKGKSAKEFRPFDNLTRAEAAVMIRRTLEKDIEEMAKGTESFMDVSADMGIMPSGLPLINQ